MEKIGIYGGTFDPIHLGHLIIAQCFVEQFSLDKCYFVPAKISPFKIEQNLTFSDAERIKMIELSIKENPNFAIDTYEIENTDISYTINTIRYFRSKYPLSELFLLIGYDQAINFDKWKNSELIKNLANIVVARRDLNIHDFVVHLPEEFKMLENPLISISSTDIRKRMQEGKSIRYYVLDGVWEFLTKEKYGN